MYRPNAYLALEEEAAKIGMKINEQKTKYMIATGNRTILEGGQLWLLATGNSKSSTNLCSWEL
jgi:6-phosphogluconolactonase/glucosamine-6-phosphate isomerase/deaminase